MQPTVTPANIASAAFAAQFLFTFIAYIGAVIIKQSDNRYVNHRGEPRFNNFAWVMTIFILTTFGLILFSDAFSRLWQPILNDLQLVLITWEKAIIYSFCLDICLIAYLVYYTGGSQKSAFSGLYFLIPTLSILLREPLMNQLGYASFAIMLFTLFFNDRQKTAETRPVRQGQAFWVITVASFLLTLFIAHRTRIS